MRNKKIYVSMRLHPEPATRPPTKFILPEGCVGIMFAFKNKKSTLAFDGKDVAYVEAEIIDKEQRQ